MMARLMASLMDGRLHLHASLPGGFGESKLLTMGVFGANLSVIQAR